MTARQFASIVLGGMLVAGAVAGAAILLPEIEWSRSSGTRPVTCGDPDSLLCRLHSTLKAKAASVKSSTCVEYGLPTDCAN
jgi:hypothetical protein